MGQVAVTVNGRTYRLKCGDGEEARLLELAGYLTARVEAVAKEFGQVGDDRLLLMAALLITDELFDVKARAVAAPAAGEAPSATDRRPARRGKTAAARTGSEPPEPREEPPLPPTEQPA